jgi:hypothetical protein
MTRTMILKLRVTKAHWYRLGGFANSNCYRRATKSGAWTYWVLVGQSA